MNLFRQFFTITISAVVSTCGLVACSEDPDDTSAASTGAGGMTGAGGTGGVGGGPSALACQSAGGICIQQDACAQANGMVAASNPAGCDSNNVPAECCVPPAPQQNPTTCAEAGGLCAPIGGCLAAGGYFTSANAGCNAGASFACCVPHVRCGEETIECCHDSYVAYPACDSGKLVCTGGEPVPKGTCKVP
jgi:hypothetical protein